MQVAFMELHLMMLKLSWAKNSRYWVCAEQALGFSSSGVLNGYGIILVLQLVPLRTQPMPLLFLGVIFHMHKGESQYGFSLFPENYTIFL